MPERIQLSRAKGWRMPANTMPVTRPGPWGNPFAIWHGPDSFGVERWHVSDNSCHWTAPSEREAKTLAVEKFEQHMQRMLAREIYPAPVVLHELRGRNLACWCTLGSPCHADVLLRLANA